MADFGRNFAARRRWRPSRSVIDQIFRRHHAFVHAGGSGENAVVVETDGEVAFAGDNVAALVHPASRDTNVAAMLLFSSCGTSGRSESVVTGRTLSSRRIFAQSSKSDSKQSSRAFRGSFLAERRTDGSLESQDKSRRKFREVSGRWRRGQSPAYRRRCGC